MPIKDINELLNMTIVREKKKRFSDGIRRFSERTKPKVNPKYTEMGDVVPPVKSSRLSELLEGGSKRT